MQILLNVYTVQKIQQVVLWNSVRRMLAAAKQPAVKIGPG